MGVMTILQKDKTRSRVRGPDLSSLSALECCSRLLVVRTEHFLETLADVLGVRAGLTPSSLVCVRPRLFQFFFMNLLVEVSDGFASNMGGNDSNSHAYNNSDSCLR